MSLIRTQKFGAGSVILRAQGQQPLELDEIRANAPSVFAEEKHASRSERYTYIPTEAVLVQMWREGFRPFEVRQGGSRDDEKRGFTKHMIRFRQVSEGGQLIAGVDQTFPEVIMLNSHDGTSSYRLDSGLFRMVCTNGLMSGDVYESFRVPHKGDIVSNVIDAAYKVVSEFPQVVDGANRMAALQLTGPEQTAFATAAAQLRWEPDDDNRSTVPEGVALRLNDARRREDVGADLWRTFNRVQERLMTGGLGYQHRSEAGRRSYRHTRPVNGIDQNRGLNRALWTLAEEMQRIKSAA